MVKQSDMPPIQAVAVAPLLCRADYRDEVQRRHREGMSELAIAQALNLSRCLVRELIHEQQPLFGRRPVSFNLKGTGEPVVPDGLKSRGNRAIMRF